MNYYNCSYSKDGKDLNNSNQFTFGGDERSERLEFSSSKIDIESNKEGNSENRSSSHVSIAIDNLTNFSFGKKDLQKNDENNPIKSNINSGIKDILHEINQIKIIPDERKNIVQKR